MKEHFSIGNTVYFKKSNINGTVVKKKDGFILVQLVGSDFVQWCKRDEITKLANNKIKANTFVNNKLSAKGVK